VSAVVEPARSGTAPTWELVSSRPAPETPLQGRMKAARPHFYRLVKH
jgi:hypothetical protein